MASEAYLKKLVEPYVDLPLECDGLTRVLNRVLLQAPGVFFNVFSGKVEWKGKEFPLHFWIELPGGKVIDYRLRMWFGKRAPHGIFDPKKKGVKYDGKLVHMRPVDDHVFMILTGGMLPESKERDIQEASPEGIDAAVLKGMRDGGQNYYKSSWIRLAANEAVTGVKHSASPYSQAQVLASLRRLERDGKVKSSGMGRSNIRWELVDMHEARDSFEPVQESIEVTEGVSSSDFAVVKVEREGAIRKFGGEKATRRATKSVMWEIRFKGDRDLLMPGDDRLLNTPMFKSKKSAQGTLDDMLARLRRKGRLDEGRTTYHGRDGRFTRSRAAHTVTRGGERFKMVRQLRRIGPKAAPEPPEDAPEDEAPTEEEVEARRSLNSLLSASPGWTSLNNVTEAIFGKERPVSSKKRHRNWKDIEDAERRGERKDPSSTAHKPDQWYDDDVYADYEVAGEG
jgi:hypothetical protein